MANHGSRAEEFARPAGADTPLHPTSQFVASDRDVETLINTWASDIERAARRAAHERGLGYDAAQEFAQAARMALVRIATRAHEFGPFYLRRVIQNAIRDAARQELRTYGTAAPLDETDSAVDPTTEEQSELVARVGEWVSMLPARLQELYDLLYVQGYTQREAAPLMGVSQPRVAQLHNTLVRRGRSELMAPAA